VTRQNPSIAPELSNRTFGLIVRTLCRMARTSKRPNARLKRSNYRRDQTIAAWLFLALRSERDAMSPRQEGNDEHETAQHPDRP
jgi:hypothetical protein